MATNIQKNVNDFREGQNKPVFWALCFAVASFSYELPIINVFNYYRLNPRLFDIALFILVMVSVLYFSRKSEFKIFKNQLLRPWGICVIGIEFGSLVSLFWIPEDSIKYSVFFALKYSLSFVFLFLALGTKLSLVQVKMLLRVALVSGAFASSIAVLQGFGLVSSFSRYTSEGIFITERLGMIAGTLESSFQLATQGCLYFVIAITLLVIEKGFWKLLSFLSMFISMLSIFYSGVRSGILMLALIIIVNILFHPSLKLIKRIYLLITIGIIAFALYPLVMNTQLGNNFRTVARVQQLIRATFEEQPKSLGTYDYSEEFLSNNLWQRIITPFRQLQLLLSWNIFLVLLFGNGYGVVETILSTQMQHLHSIYLWPLQYGGILPVIGFLYLSFFLVKKLNLLRMSSSSSLVRVLAHYMFCYFFAWAIVGLSGQVFWFYEGLGSFTNFLLLIWGILMEFLPPSTPISPQFLKG